jgi:hypothetical protein
MKDFSRKFLGRMEVYPNNPQDNLLFKCNTRIDYEEYASIEEACALFPEAWGLEYCNKTRGQLFSGAAIVVPSTTSTSRLGRS